MIRFFDKEIVCITNNEVDRSILRSYFLRGHIDDVIVVLDESGYYIGYISYSSLLYHENIEDAIDTSYVMLNEDVWRNGREFFRQYESTLGEIPILPVLNREKQLICFAYEDEEANREIRMLRELEEGKNVLGFSDLYPQYDCVTIEGFNELAYYFAEYLKHQKIPVRVTGELWNELGEWESCAVLDYRNYQVYAEGTEQISEKLKERLLYSVSPEFECVDIIYEANLDAGIISDACGEWSSLLEKLRNKKEIVICGINQEAQDTYDLLLANGIEASSFVTKMGNNKQKLFGKDILSEKEAFRHFKHPVFIECGGQCSTWGLDGVDNYDYYGFRRNEQYFMIRDYIEVLKSNLLHVIEGKRILLAGDIYLCNRLSRYMEQKVNVQLEYVNLLEEDCHDFKMTEWIKSKPIDDTLCLLVLPEKFSDYERKEAWNIVIAQYMTKLEEMRIVNYTNYFSSLEVFMELEDVSNKYTIAELLPKGIVVGSISGYSGNIFIRDVLHGHPNIRFMDYSVFNDNLFLYCLRLAEVEACKILSHFWRLYEEEAGIERIKADFPDKVMFEKEMNRLLALKNTFTSQELFIIFHIAYAKMCENEVKDIRQIVIYWEPHNVPRKKHNEKCGWWLKNEKISGYTLKMTRNRYITAGSVIKAEKERVQEFRNWIGYYLGRAVEREEFGVLEYVGWNAMTIRFEDFKCNPTDTYREICKKLGIIYEEKYLRNIHINMRESFAKGFDLKPVYNQYEEYLSSLDRMKISLIRRQYQKKYNYPYMNTYDFTRKELQQMFVKNMRFEENLLSTCDIESQYAYYIERQRKVSEKLWELRQMERMEEKSIRREQCIN